MISNKYGHWTVNNIQFNKKIDALTYASKFGVNRVNYHYFDHAWESYNKDKIGMSSLNDLYAERAKQLRDKYDYLILNYSGGSDSHNILMTFLKNKIKLDAVYVKWPIRTQKSEIYKPTHDTSSYNFLSEWDLTIQKRLDFISKNFPEVKIIITDWSENITEKFFKESMLDKVDHLYSPGDIVRLTSHSSEELQMVDKGLKVGSIWGIDKPDVYIEKGDVFSFRFRDSAATVGHPSEFNKEGTEYFYWSPEFPDIVYEQAFSIYKYFKANPNFLHLIPKYNDNFSVKNTIQRYIMLSRIVKYIIYDTWDEMFQVDKSNEPGKLDWDSWLYNEKEFSFYITNWEYSFDSFIQNVDYRFCNSFLGKKMGVVNLFTKSFPIGKI
jgi:hypothetical protein